MIVLREKQSFFFDNFIAMIAYYSTSTSTLYCLPTKRRFWLGDRLEWKTGNTLKIELERG